MVVKMTISLSAELAEFAEQLARERDCPKSRVFAELLERRRRELLAEALAAGYRELAADNRRFARQALPLAAEVWDDSEWDEDEA